MDTGEMVEQLIEKRLTDYVEAELERPMRSNVAHSLEEVVKEIIGDKVREKFDIMRSDIERQVIEMMDKSEFEVSASWRGITIGLKEKEAAPLDNN